MSVMNLRVTVVVVVVSALVVGVRCATTTPGTQPAPFEDECPIRNSCRQRSGVTDFDKDLCYCDALCNTYADCCYDSEFRNASLQKIDETSNVKCHASSEGSDEVYMKVACKEGWADAEMEDLCVGGGVDTDPRSGLPVTSSTTGYTYSNYYCAICNEDILSPRLWNMNVACDLPRNESIDVSDLLFRNNSWGVLRARGSESQDFHKCHLSSKVPQDIKNRTRNCSVFISTCSDDWQDEEVASQCHSYTAVVYSGIDSARYRNHHCARCNKLEEPYSCYPNDFVVAERLPPRDSGFSSFALLFDFTDHSRSNLVGTSSPCNFTQVWDPFFKRCRSIVCPNSNQDYRYGRCVTLSDDNSMEVSEPPASPPTAATERAAAATENTTTNITTSSNATVNSSSSSVTDNITTPNISYTLPPSTTHSPGTFPEGEHRILFPEDPTEPPTTPSEEPPTTLPPTTPSPTDASTPVSSTTPLLPDTDATPTTDESLSTNTSAEFTECYKVTLREGEFTDLPNGSIHVTLYDRTYVPGEFARTSESVLVCLPDISASRKFSASLGWVSLAGLSLSCACLLLHLAAFALLPELRNLSGRNLASLCLALLAAYITLLINMLTRPNSASCVTLAAAMYYFFVTSCTWMNVIAFDVWYTFRLAQRQLRVSSGDQWHRFIAYSLYSWLLPAAATVVLVLVDQLEPHGVSEEFLPRLGRAWCWFSHRRSLLAFFAAPMVIIIVINCIFFVSSAAIITQTTSTAAAASARGNQPRGQYKMYLRLAVLMGFTWLSGIAAGYLDLEALWYVFVVLNTLQGVFIFLAFTFRTRIWQDVGNTCSKLLQRGLSKVTRRAPPRDIRAFELSHTPENTSASYPTPNTSLDAC